MSVHRANPRAANSKIFHFLLLIAIFIAANIRKCDAHSIKNPFGVLTPGLTFGFQRRCLNIPHFRSVFIRSTPLKHSSSATTLCATEDDSELEHMFSEAGGNQLPIDLPKAPILDEMNALITRGIPINDLKSLFFNPVEACDALDTGATSPEERMFGSLPDGEHVTLLGEDDDEDLEKEMQKHEYNPVDLFTQSLMATILNFECPTQEKPSYTYDRLNEAALAFKDILDGYYVPNARGLPDTLYEWNRQYKMGLEKIPLGKRDAYSKLWYKRLHDFMIYAVSKYKSLYDDAFDSELYKFFVDADPDETGPHLTAGDKVLDIPMWSAFLSPAVLEFVAKYDGVEKIKKNFGSKQEDIDDFYADLLKAQLARCQDPDYQKVIEYEREKKRLEYVKFIQTRRSNWGKAIKFRPLSVMPFWVWDEFWREKDHLIPDTMAEILKDIVMADPMIDLGEITGGTFENAVEKDTTGDLKTDVKATIYKEGSEDFSSAAEFIANHKEKQQQMINNGTLPITSEKESKYPKPLGYYFKNVLSYSKFKEAYKDFNMKHFGTPHSQLYKGQLVKGIVYRVEPTKMLVDIHAPVLAYIYLREAYETPDDVPKGGFKAQFSPGDELMFHVTEIWPHKIVLSLNRIKALHRFRGILNFYNDDTVFNVKVLQRYTKGLLVQYDGGDANTAVTEAVAQEYTQEEIAKMENVGWIPLNKIAAAYRNPKQITRLDLVGQYIPAVFDTYDYIEDLPILSNVRAIQRMQIMHMKPGDVVKGKIISYTRQGVKILLGEVTGKLLIGDMSDYSYKNHLKGHGTTELLACVTVPFPPAETVDLSTNILPSDMDGVPVNQFMKRFREAKDNVAMYQQMVKDGVFDSQVTGVEIMGHEGETITTDTGSNTSVAVGRKPGIALGEEDCDGQDLYGYGDGEDDDRAMEDTAGIAADGDDEVVKWDLLNDDYLQDDEALNYWFNKRRWQVLDENDKWQDLSKAEQAIINRGKNCHDEVLYYRISGVNYKIDFEREIRVDLKSQVVEPLRDLPWSMTN